MGILQRMGSLVSANVNDLVDLCEDPEKMLKQAIREMEAALGRSMDAAARAIAHQRMLAHQSEDERRHVERLQQVAEAAVERGDDPAARRALRHKAERRQFATTLAEQATAAEELSHRLRNQVATMRIKLAEARRKLLEVAARSRAAIARRTFADNFQIQSGNITAFSNLERVYANFEQREAETEALFELLHDSEPGDLFDADVDTELNRLKQRAKHEPTSRETASDATP